jgi:type I restriction enzyme S subunit
MSVNDLLRHFDRVAYAPDAVHRLRAFILDLAVRGRLVPQAGAGESVDASDGPLLLPAGWHWASLESLASGGGLFTDGDWVESKDQDPQGSVRLTQLADVGVGKFRDRSERFMNEATALRLNCTFLAAGDILIARMPDPLGRACIFPGDAKRCVTVVDVAVLRLGGQNAVAEYMVCAINSPVFARAVAAKAAGATRSRISRGNLGRLQLPMPPMEEQRRIVAKVDELMALCDRLETARSEREAARDRLAAASLARLNAPDSETFVDDARFALDVLPALTTRHDQIKQLRQIVLNLAVRGKLVDQHSQDEPIKAALIGAMARRTALVQAKSVRTKKLGNLPDPRSSGELPPSWSLARLGDLVDPENTISYGVLVPGNDVAHGVPFVRAQDLTLKAHPERPNKTIAPEVEAPYARTRLRGGEILVCVVGSIGKLGTVPDSWAGANIARAVARILPIPEVSRDYLLVVLQSQPVQDFFRETTRTLAQPTLNVGLIEQTPIPLPPIAEQHRIVAKVNDLMSLCDQLEASLNTATEHRSRLLEALIHDALASGSQADASALTAEVATA